MKFSPDTWNGLKAGAVSVAFAGLMGIGLSLGYIARTAKGKHIDSYRIVSRTIADLDGLPGTTSNDWAIVYRNALGREFDQYVNNPRNDLSLGDLEKVATYISNSKSGR